MSLEIGKALEHILGGVKMDIEGRDFEVKTHYGDQFELNKWVSLMNDADEVKYPLVYYALNKDYTDSNGWFRSKVMLILLMNTEYNPLNTTRVDDTYKDVLYPLRKLVEKKISSSRNVVLYGNIRNRFKKTDEPLMGITTDDFIKLRSQTKESVTTDMVDALILEFDAEINTLCV